MSVLTALGRTAMRALGDLLAPWLRAVWRMNAGSTSKPSPFMRALGILIGIVVAVFGLCNLYFWATSGLIYRLARHVGTGWISFESNPIAFVFWAGFSSLPVVIPALLVLGYFSLKRQAKRAALRQLTEGTGPAPIVRRLDGR